MTTFTINTKADKDAVSKSTKLTIDFSTVTKEQLEQIATSVIVIRRQAHYRKNGAPAEDSVNACQFVPGVRMVAAPVSIDQLVSKMTQEEKMKLAEQLMNM